MFTGIIQAIGQISKIEPRSGDSRLKIATGKLDMADVAVGDSIACNGVCLTAVELGKNYYVADVSAETLRLTTLGRLKTGSAVNLEKALTPTSRLGGHLVSGHVDGVGKIIRIHKEARSVAYQVEPPLQLARYIAKKGSITVDGVSLTVNDLIGNDFMLNLVPHTLGETCAQSYHVGSEVNLEVDLLARYLERLLQGQSNSQQEPSARQQKPSASQSSPSNPSQLDYQLLVSSGFIR